MTSVRTGWRCLLATSLLMVMVALSGCVTTTTSPFTEDANRQEAVRDYVRLGTAYISQGNYERARGHLQRALEIDSESSPAHAAMGLLHEADGEKDLAEASYQAALEHEPDYTRGRVYYGTFLYNQGRYDEAVTAFRLASRDTNYKDRASVFHSLGKSHQALGDWEAATSAYRRAVELSRGEPQHLLSLSHALLETGDPVAAQRYYDRLTRLMNRNSNLQHSPESLLVGLKVAREFEQRNREASLALLLKKRYPESREWQIYQSLASDDE